MRKRRNNFLPNHLLDLSLLFLALSSAAVISLSLEHSAARDWFCSLNLCFTATHYSQWNELFYSLAVGTLVSLIFYLVVVRLPDHRNRKIVKSVLRLRYHQFKEDCIINFLEMAGELDAFSQAQELVDFRKFRTYFKGKHPTYGDKWYAVLNNINDYRLAQISNALLQFRHELEFALLKLQANDEEALAVLRHLGHVLNDLSRTQTEYESEKYFGRQMWSLFTEFDLTTGQRDFDLVEDLIDRL
tara:strand:- start:132 stop:863 length:732 start_codon:yes stop_codon:yes gene_type:complete